MTDAASSFHGTERYELRRCLGKGGFGVVWEAFDRDQEQRVALKTLRDLRSDALVSFKSEFRRLTGFVHPNLVRLYELTEADGTWFFTMELVDGVPFKSWVRPGHRTVDESTFNLSLDSHDVLATGDTGEHGIVRLEDRGRPVGVLDEARLRDAFAQLVVGVSAMHADGMVHRDIKPSNILVSAAGRVVLLDFGLAAELAARRTGREKLRIGTPAYMPPEVAVGGGHEKAGDWYSVGVVLFEALTGRVPFRGTPRAVLRSKAAMDAPDPVPMVPDSLRDLAFLARDLLARDPSVRPTAEEVRERLGIGTPTTALGEGAFVGRTKELDDLARLLARAREGECAVALITGPSGMGKSALVRHFVDDLDDCVVLQGRCYERESVPFKALDELIDDLAGWLGGLPRRERKALIPEDVGALTRLFPALAPLIDAAHVGEADSVEVRRLAAHALDRLLHRIAESHTLVLEVDDVQWGDADSAAVLELLLQRGAPRLLLLATCRENGLDREVPALLRRLIEDGTVVGGHVEVGALSAEESRELAASLLGEEDPRVAQLVGEAGGHPLFLDGLVRYAESGAGGSLDDMIRGHVAKLPEDAVRVLRLVSVAPQPVPRRLIRRASRLKGDQAATSQLVVDRLVHTVGAAEDEILAPYHSRVREAVLADVDELTMRLCHRELADAMEELGWGEVEHLFLHRKGAGERDRARELALEAAASAEAAYAFYRAAQLYAEARELGAVGWELGEKEGAAWVAAGRPAAAADAFLAAIEAGAPPDQAKDLRRRAAEQLLAGGHADRGIELTREVLAPLDLRLAPSPRWALVSLLWQRAQLQLRGFEPRTDHEPTPEELYKVDTCWSMASGLAIIDTFVATDFQVRQLRLALDAGEPYRVARALALEASYVAANGHSSRPKALELLARAEAMAEELDSPHLRAFIPLCRAMCDFLCSRWRESAAGMLVAEAILERECRDVTWELSQTTTFYVDAVHNMGQMSLLGEVVGPRLAAARARGNKQLVHYLQYMQASMVRMAEDQPERGLEEMRELDHRSPYGFHYTDWWRMYGASNLLLYKGRAGEARELWEKDWRALKGSMFLLVEVMGLPGHYQRAMLRTAVAAEMAPGLARTHELCLAERTARWLVRHDAPWGQAAGELLHALVASARGEEEAALAAFTRAEQAHEALDMALVAHVCRYRRGELLQGEEGEARRREALAGVRELGVRAPGRMIDFYAPVRIR